MQIFEYPASFLPGITYSGQQDSREKPWRNIRRTTDEYILYFVLSGFFDKINETIKNNF